MLRYLTDAPLRRRVTAATNEVESFNRFSQWVGFGARCVIADNDPVEQEKAMKFNALLTSAVIFHNALDIVEIVRQLLEEGWTTEPEDLAHISPYLIGRINRFGEYSSHELGIQPEAYDPKLTWASPRCARRARLRPASAWPPDPPGPGSTRVDTRHTSRRTWQPSVSAYVPAGERADSTGPAQDRVTGIRGITMAQNKKTLALAAATAVIGGGFVCAPAADAVAPRADSAATERATGSAWRAVDGLQGEAKAAAGDYIYYFKFAHSNKCAEVPGLSKARGKGLDQWTCTGKGHHWWYLTEGPGSTRHVVNYNSKLCMNVKGGSTANKARVVQWDCNNQNNGLWVLEYHSQYGQYRLVNAKSGKCLNVRGASKGNGADLIQYTCSNAANNRFWAID